MDRACTTSHKPHQHNSTARNNRLREKLHVQTMYDRVALSQSWLQRLPSRMPRCLVGNACENSLGQPYETLKHAFVKTKMNNKSLEY